MKFAQETYEKTYIFAKSAEDIDFSLIDDYILYDDNDTMKKYKYCKISVILTHYSI